MFQVIHFLDNPTYPYSLEPRGDGEVVGVYVEPLGNPKSLVVVLVTGGGRLRTRRGPDLRLGQTREIKKDPRTKSTCLGVFGSRNFRSED